MDSWYRCGRHRDREMDGERWKYGISVGIHAALLPDNKLLCIERPHTQPYPLLNPNTGGFTSTLTDLTSETLTPLILRDLQTNPFCAGHSQASDGGIWVFGGDRQPSNDSTIGFTLQSGIFGRRKFMGMWENEDVHGNMTGGARWYPTVVTLFDDSVIIISGTTTNLDFDDLGKNMNPHTSITQRQILTPKISIFWSALQKDFVMVSNRTVTIDKEDNDRTVEIDQLVADGNHEPWIYPLLDRNSPTAFLLPMYEETGYKAVVMVCGGVKRVTTLASEQCWSIDADGGGKWEKEADMPRGRLMPDSVLLPDGRVLFVNGAKWGVAGGNAGQTQYAAGPIYETDLYNPVTKTWTPGVGIMSISRLYHSGAILLEDGSVITVGSEMQNHEDFWGTRIVGRLGCRLVGILMRRGWRGMSLPIWGRSGGPVIKNAPRVVTHNSTIVVEINEGVKVASVSLIRGFWDRCSGAWWALSFVCGDGEGVPSVGWRVLLKRGEKTDVEMPFQSEMTTSVGVSGTPVCDWGSW
ncbi:hypothetical protein BC829DRAFT_415820 [Chytridium lagenaria]|nr:hypothetical protein BC829DRAFT_415820 [Chytridium lagenaria]